MHCLFKLGHYLSEAKVKTAYLDIETNYVGTFNDQRLFRDCKNHKITVIGIRITEGEKDAFIQLVDEEATRETLMAVLEGVERSSPTTGAPFRTR